MKAKEIVYEQPLNELIRVSLRLEHLFNRLAVYLKASCIDHHTQTIVSLIIDILNLLDRPDLKSKMTKEFNRYVAVLSSPAYEGSSVKVNAIDKTIARLKELTDHFLNTPGKIAQHLRENLFLSTIRQYLLSPGGDSCIDAPHYYYWLNEFAYERKNQIDKWNSAFDEIREAVTLILKIIRSSSKPIDRIAEKGFYHESLQSQVPVQLIRVGISSENIYPEISAGRHRMSIRFVIPDMNSRPKQTQEDIAFRLTKCVI